MKKSILILIFLTTPVRATDYYLFFFTTYNCQYCEKAKTECIEPHNSPIATKFKEIVFINTNISTTKTDHNISLNLYLTIQSHKNKTFNDELFNKVTEKCMLRGAATISEKGYPGFVILSPNKGGRLEGLKSWNGYTNKSSFEQEISEIIK